ncbi:MAG TPA: electron transfer flavoprotein subunit alpha/FixB family protein [Pirellula sp.]|nr:electron transfer flavoprotein subunit alpha/FixB family protein [Pirellula sp.]
MSCIFGWNGLDRAAMGVLGAGQRLAINLASNHVGLIVGPALDALITQVANFADGIVVVDHPLLINYHSETTLAALAEVSKKMNPHAVLFGNETHCQELVPRLAHRLNGSAAADVLSLKVKSEKETVLVTRSVYGGKAQATIELRRSPAIIWVRARAQEPAVQQTQKAEITRWSVALEPNTQIKLINRQTVSQELARLEDARVIVSGGRGLAGPDPFTQLKALAEVIGGQMAASRAACDAGWVPAEWQVGQTGKKVSPQLYLAIAISGASQHIMGIADAKTIAAINLDPDAPIFQHCQFGIVDDYRQVVGPLREKLIELLA